MFITFLQQTRFLRKEVSLKAVSKTYIALSGLQFCCKIYNINEENYMGKVEFLRLSYVGWYLLEMTLILGQGHVSYSDKYHSSPPTSRSAATRYAFAAGWKVREHSATSIPSYIEVKSLEQKENIYCLLRD